MKVHVEVEMSAVVVVLFLALGASHGQVTDKCQLGKELNKTLPANLLDHFPNLVAKIVCHVGLSSHFNTSTINNITGPDVHCLTQEDHGKHKGESKNSGSAKSSKEKNNSSKGPQRRGRSAEESSSGDSSEENSSNSAERRRRSAKSSSEESSENYIWTLYGLFQLPNRLACTSGPEPTLNLCSMACDRLIDNLITDDITCVETLLNQTLSTSPGPNKAVFSQFQAIFFQKECNNVEDLTYFSTC